MDVKLLHDSVLLTGFWVRVREAALWSPSSRAAGGGGVKGEVKGKATLHEWCRIGTEATRISKNAEPNQPNPNPSPMSGNEQHLARLPTDIYDAKNSLSSFINDKYLINLLTYQNWFPSMSKSQPSWSINSFYNDGHWLCQISCFLFYFVLGFQLPRYGRQLIPTLQFENH